MAESNVFMRARDLRASFVDYFRTARHEAMDAASIVPHGDDSLLFTNAGMVRFKDVLSGAVKPECKRAVTVQPCIRAGGKHNDLDEVGYTTRHHTFFEMLGNFSFGDYFKEEAIELAWKLLVREWGVDEQRLFVTVHERDEESRDLWRKIASLPENRIHIISSDDNFWSMGEVGPCGYCTEIFYDYETGDGAIDANGVSGNRFVEIWNLVFMQYEKMADGTRRDLTRHGVDTGMGLERIATVMQGKRDNYETDELSEIMNHISDRSKGWHRGSSFFSVDETVALKVMTDHLRAACALLAAGVIPDREGRGYVLRRIMRRAMRYAHGMGAEGAVLHECLPFVAQTMSSSLSQQYDIKAMANCVCEEEEQFAKTLTRGLTLLQDKLALLPKDKPQLSGEDAFRLYDTYGFPLEVTRDVLRRVGGTVDEETYQDYMEFQAELSRKEDDIAPWAAQFPKTEFIGYKEYECEATVLGVMKRGNGGVAVILDRTPFYGERGGQRGDEGVIDLGRGFEWLAVEDTKNFDEVVVHLAREPSHFRMNDETISIGDKVMATIKVDHRHGLCVHHTATHLLHEALRRVLGDHVEQRGSRVSHNRLRFDFSHSKPVSEDEMKAIEEEVTEQIICGHEVITKEMPIEEARESGARALFGEKYGDVVRVVSMGDYSVELCGGTHVKSTDVCQNFKVIWGGGIGSGVRRIEALASDKAATDYERGIELDKQIKKRSEIEKKAKVAKRQADQASMLLLIGSDSDKAVSREPLRDGMNWVHRDCGDASHAELRALADALKKKEGNKKLIVSVMSQHEGRVHVVVTRSDDVSLSAVQLLKQAVAPFDGSGGGRDDFAQGGLPHDDCVHELTQKIEQLITNYEAR